MSALPPCDFRWWVNLTVAFVALCWLLHALGGLR